MIRLRVLGSMDVERGPGGERASALLAKPRLTALAVYLLVERPGGWYRRDGLAALFWSEADQSRARASLSQALYQLRRHLGPDCIETRGTEELRLADGAVTCDALTVRDALGEADDRRACEAYRGDLLPAFHLPNAPEFGHWLDRERATLRNAALQAAWRLAERAESSEDPETAGMAYRLAGDISLLDGVGVARAMAGLSRVGEPAGALELFDRHAMALRTELDGVPDATVEALARALRAADLVAPRRLDPGLTTRRPTAVATHAAPRGRRGTRAAAALLAIAVLGVLLVSQLSSFRGTAASDPTLVAVLPFAYEGADTANSWIARALPLALVPLLDGTGGVRAVPESRVSPSLAARGIAWDDPVSPANARALARELGAGLFLTGHVFQDADRRYVTATLADARSGDVRQTVRFGLDSLDVVETVERLADELLIGLVDQQPRARELLSVSSTALRAFVDGWAARHEQQYVEATRQFQRAMDIDSTFALAALAYREAAQWLPDGSPHVLALDQADGILAHWRSHLNTADRAVADAILATYRLDSNGRDVLTTLRRATLVAPGRPSSWLLLGDFLLHDGGMLALPDFTARAEAAFDTVRALGSLLPEAERHTVEIQFALGDTAAARAYLRMHPRDTTAFDHLRWTAAWLADNSVELNAFGDRLDHEPPLTWRWMLWWSQRAGVGFDHADRAATLLAASTPLDDVRRVFDRGLVRYYLANRGRPRQASRFPRIRYPEAYQHPVDQMELALGLPEAWVDLDSVAQRLEERLDALHPADRLWAACNLGAWHALRGHASTAQSMARTLSVWSDDSDVRRRSVATTCPTVIRALTDTSAGLLQLHQADSVLLSEPAGVLRTDITLWSLLLARAYRDRGRPDLGLPLTTRRAFLVEASAYLTPALLLEGDLSLAVGDSARAARAYTRASRLLSRPEPAVAESAREVRHRARDLAVAACGGDCGPYRP